MIASPWDWEVEEISCVNWGQNIHDQVGKEWKRLLLKKMSFFFYCHVKTWCKEHSEEFTRRSQLTLQMKGIHNLDWSSSVIRQEFQRREWDTNLVYKLGPTVYPICKTEWVRVVQR